MKRLTYQTAGDATRQAHYCAGYGVKKDDVVQRLGEYEDTGLTPEEIRQALCLLRQSQKLLKSAEFRCREDKNEADGLYDQLKKFVGGYADEV